MRTIAGSRDPPGQERANASVQITLRLSGAAFCISSCPCLGVDSCIFGACGPLGKPFSGPPCPGQCDVFDSARDPDACGPAGPSRLRPFLGIPFCLDHRCGCRAGRRGCRDGALVAGVLAWLQPSFRRGERPGLWVRAADCIAVKRRPGRHRNGYRHCRLCAWRDHFPGSVRAGCGVRGGAGCDVRIGHRADFSGPDLRHADAGFGGGFQIRRRSNGTNQSAARRICNVVGGVRIRRGRRVDDDRACCRHSDFPEIWRRHMGCSCLDRGLQPGRQLDCRAVGGPNGSASIAGRSARVICGSTRRAFSSNQPWPDDGLLGSCRVFIRRHHRGLSRRDREDVRRGAEFADLRARLHGLGVRRNRFSVVCRKIVRQHGLLPMGAPDGGASWTPVDLRHPWFLPPGQAGPWSMPQTWTRIVARCCVGPRVKDWATGAAGRSRCLRGPVDADFTQSPDSPNLFETGQTSHEPPYPKRLSRALLNGARMPSAPADHVLRACSVHDVPAQRYLQHVSDDPGGSGVGSRGLYRSSSRLGCAIRRSATVCFPRSGRARAGSFQAHTWSAWRQPAGRSCCICRCISSGALQMTSC